MLFTALKWKHLHHYNSLHPKTLFQSCQISWGARSLAMPILSRHRSRPRVWGCGSPTGPAWCQHEAYSRLLVHESSLFWAFITDSALIKCLLFTYFCCKFASCHISWRLRPFVCLPHFFAQLAKPQILRYLESFASESSKGTNFVRRHQRQDAAARFGLMLFHCS